MHAAVFAADHKHVLELLESGAVDVNSRTPGAVTPAHVALWKADLDILRTLLDRGAQPDLPDAMGHTCLHTAVRQGNAQAVALLLQRGANPNVADRLGHSPLHAAADARVAALLLQHGAQVNPRSARGETPLALAMARGQSELAGLLRAHGGRR